MAVQDNLIDFDVIDAQKENIQALPSGRSAKALAQIYSPPLLGPHHSSIAANDAQIKARAAFERELLTIDEADDPLDIYDRYVKWTLNTFPSAQATPQSQLLPLLERATKTFQHSAEHKNDPRYLRLWLHYIRLFSDAPRETFVFLARSAIGENLALYYEEFAAWLETSRRWSQADEVYLMGIDKAARPTERLARKYDEFRQRRQAQPQESDEPSSPALPVARPALAAKVDPFSLSASTSAGDGQQTSTTSKKAKSGKLQIFADAGVSQRPDSGSGSAMGWDNIGTIAERKKENHMAARPMAGETLNTGKTNAGTQKIMIFRDNVS